MTCFAAAEDPEVVLHNFSGGGPYQPEAGLIADASGNLYGVTGVYGVLTNCSKACGTVFELSPSASGYSFSTIYTFKGGVDGVAPSASLTLGPDGSLYGTTSQGGGSCQFQQGGCGTVFKLTPNSSGAWTETMLHRFLSTADGAIPFSSVVLDASGNVYGATDFAGQVSATCPQGCGTVFEISPDGSSWTFHVIHIFTGGADGAFGGDLVFDTEGNLYGATGGGGPASDICGGMGCGTIFKMTSSGGTWTHSVIYTFASSSDGFSPLSLIFDSQGDLFGSTLFGGHGNSTTCSPNGCGAVFELSPSGSGWNFTLIHSFTGKDGANPSGIVFGSDGNLYGATENAGPSCCGTIFQLAPSVGGALTMLYDFNGGTDGDYPPGPPVFVGENLYGVTSNGGSLGSGVVFELSQ